jgi:hypothetical protein
VTEAQKRKFKAFLGPRLCKTCGEQPGHTSVIRLF